MIDGVAKILRFRRRLKSLNEFDSKQRIRFWPEEKRRSWWFAARPFVLLAGLVLAWAGLDPALVEPPSFLASSPERVTQSFSRCGPGRRNACVIDGDTFKLGERKVRVIGIDAPEVHAQCAEEARLAEQATVKLQALLNQGPFEMVAPVYGKTDRYGRDLRTIRRTLPDGRIQSIADEMRSAGLAHRYLGGIKPGWC